MHTSMGVCVNVCLCMFVSVCHLCEHTFVCMRSFCVLGGRGHECMCVHKCFCVFGGSVYIYWCASMCVSVCVHLCVHTLKSQPRTIQESPLGQALG